MYAVYTPGYMYNVYTYIYNNYVYFSVDYFELYVCPAKIKILLILHFENTHSCL